ncbi:general transcription and DNA repair factor IIH subunit TFB4 isoform X2 [Alnus glutinosa]|uniref:general transcription and DNA repair factor IIH subunit TFB4 isoform X2 n=1 Tax=Alnus glutinosa TaxID=3517 RepID=UPI002D79D70D|nr:general transcription and DNA repair factor IIH subunit TFB4 isoform X2 [Alnus glutinosa]
MASAPSKLYADDVSLLVVLLDTNPFFWSSFSFPFSKFLSHVLTFLNSILVLNQFNQVVVIATGCNSCDYIYDSSMATSPSIESGSMPALCSDLLQKLEEFVTRDEHLGKQDSLGPTTSSLLSGSLSMALCYIQRVFRSGPLHPQPRASYITGGVYQKPQQLDGLFQYLLTVFATDLHSRTFLQLPKSVGVDFRASCFCHKKTIDMGSICSVCLSIFCKHHKKCSTCGSVFGQAHSDVASVSNLKRKTPET